ncbi:MAG: hypothetical protein DHS20C15_19400 [Planctomycetota bacterium]|nr:MAG: hypothetical protein DHS20C15_19400 [Planctomycetota bacterium]
MVASPAPAPEAKAPSAFARFKLHDALLRGLDAAGFESPRPIQAATIPAGLQGRDVLGLAQTGTGKTAAFALPICHRLLRQRGRSPRALILAPTRELATQIAAEIKTLAKFTKLRLVTVFGGVSAKNQIHQLNQYPDIVVGCPGRVLDLIGQGKLKLGQVETLVLDEADHMFDMGFLPDIRRIMSSLPDERQNLLFSATMPREIRKLANDLLSDPEVVELADAAPAATIDHALYPVAETRKRALLDRFLASKDCRSAIVFTRTKHRAKRLAQQLEKAGHRATSLQGNMSQGQRDRAMRGFRAHSFDVLVATDIVARGIDVSNVSHVINFDVPMTPEAYTHRIGRTGRAEKSGVACTFVTGGDREWVRDTERMLGKPIERRNMPDFDAGDVNLAPAKAARGGGGGGGRGNARAGGPGKRAGGGKRGGSRGGAGGRGGSGGSTGGRNSSRGAASRGSRSASAKSSGSSSSGGARSSSAAAQPSANGVQRGRRVRKPGARF